MDLTIKKSEYFLKNPETGKEKDLYEVMGISNTYVFFDKGQAFEVIFYSKDNYEIHELKGVINFKDYEQN